MPDNSVPSLTLKGRTYTLDPGKLGPADDRLCRTLTDPDRFGVLQLMQALISEPALDRLAVVLFFARRQAGEPNLTLEQAEEGLTYDDLFEALQSIGKVEEVEDESGN